MQSRSLATACPCATCMRLPKCACGWAYELGSYLGTQCTLQPSDPCMPARLCFMIRAPARLRQGCATISGARWHATKKVNSSVPVFPPRSSVLGLPQSSWCSFLHSNPERSCRGIQAYIPYEPQSLTICMVNLAEHRVRKAFRIEKMSTWIQGAGAYYMFEAYTIRVVSSIGGGYILCA